MKTLHLIGFGLVLLAGCAPSEAPTARTDSMPMNDPFVKLSKSDSPLVEITPEARKRLQEVTAGFPSWWLLVTIKPGGCTGIQYKLDIDAGGPTALDEEHWSGDVRCLSAIDQRFLVQGLVIGF